MQNYSFFPLHFHGFSRTTRLCYCLCCLFVYSLFFLFEGFFVFLCARCQPTIRYCSLLSSHNSLACSLFFFFSWKKSEVGIHFQECRLYWNSKLSLSLWLLLFLPLLSILLLLLFFSSSFTLVGEVEVEKVCTLFLFFFFLPWNLCFLCSVFFLFIFSPPRSRWVIVFCSFQRCSISSLILWVQKHFDYPRPIFRECVSLPWLSFFRRLHVIYIYIYIYRFFLLLFPSSSFMDTLVLPSLSDSLFFCLFVLRVLRWLDQLFYLTSNFLLLLWSSSHYCNLLLLFSASSSLLMLVLFYFLFFFLSL